MVSSSLVISASSVARATITPVRTDTPRPSRRSWAAADTRSDRPGRMRGSASTTVTLSCLRSRCSWPYSLSMATAWWISAASSTPVAPPPTIATDTGSSR